jgi:hypothetical protein
MQSRSMDSVISDLPALKRLCDEIVTPSFHAANSEAVSPLEWKVVGGVGGNGICKWLHNEPTFVNGVCCVMGAGV